MTQRWFPTIMLTSVTAALTACATLGLPSSPLKRVALPVVEYPPAAQELSISGNIGVCFTVNKQGNTQDARICSASSTDAKKYLGPAALKAAALLVFQPRKISGSPVATHNVEQIFHFRPPAGQHAPLTTAYRSPPVYPEQALLKHIHGTAQTCFTVEPDGSVSNAHLKSASSRQVRQYLGEAALKTISNWKYYPQIVDGKPVATQDVCQTIVYTSENENNNGPTPVQRFRPHYPNNAKSHDVQGLITVCFTITADGSVSNPYIKSSSSNRARNYLGNSALHTVSQWKFLPKIVNGKPVTTHNVCQNIRYGLSYGLN